MSPAWTVCREARRRARLSQREVAARAGVSPSTIARIERGRVEPTLDLLLRVVRACGLELRMRLEPDDGSAVPRTDLDFESRLAELRNLSEFVIEARSNRGG
jgi:transcriptional regulator with XRE-family HTH domain